MIDAKTFDRTTNFHGAKGLIFVEDKILVYRRDNKTSNFPLYIDLPGGGREGNESPFETFQREAMEEFGIKVITDDLQYSKQYMSAIDPSKESYFIVTKPLSITETDVVFGNEGIEFMWLSLNEYLDLPDVIERQVKKILDYVGLMTQKKPQLPCEQQR